MMVWTAPLRDREGQIRGTISIDSDISEQKSLEEQFRQSQKLEAVGRLAGGVAHDFNNLLTVIQGYSEMIAGEAEGPLLDYAREIQYASSRASALTTQLLAFSRRQVRQPKVLDLNEVVAHSLKLLQRVIGEDIEIVTRLDRALRNVKVDPIHIDQVIMNLVVNARDAMANGGRLTIETQNQWLDADYGKRHIGVPPGGYAMIAISDTGAGMTPETRSRLFEPFFTTKESGKGTGLGLSIVYGIVKQNQGEIMVYSEPAKGTTFKIYLPAVDEAGFDTGEPAVVMAHGSETVLVCEDEEQIRDLVGRMLAMQGYQVLVAASPAEAIETSRRCPGPIHLLLTDVVMPRMNGLDLAREITRSRPETRVLYMSGYTDAHIASALEMDRNAALLQKPFTPASLSSGIRRVLGRPGEATSRGALP
jgi:nitrogen-specific signal transduction histidine kinase/CheY-like chemotaxis protein